jgi:molybdate/tungstate transport system substrate-binding protein
VPCGRTLAGLAGLAALAASCGSPAAPAATVPGTASVAYAGSLQKVNDERVGPAFSARTGVRYEGRGGGSFAVAQEIKSGEISPNVFMSIGAGPIQMLEPAYAHWYVSVAASPLVLAYDPHSRYAPVFDQVAAGRRPLAAAFEAMASPGFRLGRTDPATDPQGRAFVMMVNLAQSQLDLPGGTAARILGSVENPSQIFEETSLDSHLEAGQLDAASAYLPQAVQLHLRYVPLPASLNFGDPSQTAVYGSAYLSLPGGQVVRGVPAVVYVTVVGDRDPKAATAFVAFVLSPEGRQLYRQAGYRLVAPVLYGNRALVPPAVLHALGHP